MNDDDKRWKEAGDANGWALPPKAAWPLRLPIIRHIRAAYYAFQMERHYAFWSGTVGLARTGYDEWVIYAIARGWA